MGLTLLDLIPSRILGIKALAVFSDTHISGRQAFGIHRHLETNEKSLACTKFGFMKKCVCHD